MCSSTNSNGVNCREIQELIAWYPSHSIEDKERRRVDEHVVGCSVCADLLQLGLDLKELLVETHSVHPDADALVRFVEDKTMLDPQLRSFIQDHLVVCADCSEQATILAAIEEDLSIEKVASPSAPRTRLGSTGLKSGPRRWWHSMAAGLFKPVPAAIYLVIALVAVVSLFNRPGTDRTMGFLDGVIILPDETDRVRQLVKEEAGGTQIDVKIPQFLLLELTGLEAPPAAEDLYTVEIVEKGSTEPTITATVRGEAFLKNYSIIFPLAAGALTPGNYSAKVIDSGGNTVFQSSLNAK